MQLEDRAFRYHLTSYSWPTSVLSVDEARHRHCACRNALHDGARGQAATVTTRHASTTIGATAARYEWRFGQSLAWNLRPFGGFSQILNKDDYTCNAQCTYGENREGEWWFVVYLASHKLSSNIQ